MIYVADLDLIDPASRLPAIEGKLCVLVRAGHEVLGEEWLRAYSPLLEASTRAEIAERYRIAVPAIAAVRPASPSNPLPPGEITLIVAGNEPGSVSGCLDSMATLDESPCEVIVVGFGARSGEVVSIATSAGVRSLECAGPSTAALNAGWKAAETNVVAFVGQRVRLQKGYLGALGRSFSLPGIDVVIGQVLAAELDTYSQVTFERDLRGLNRGFERRLLARDIAPLAPHHYIGCSVNLAFRRDALVQLHGFDPTLGPGTAIGSGEAIDALQRVLEAGGVALYDPNVLVRHNHPTSRTGLLRFSRDQASALAHFRSRHMGLMAAVWRGLEPEVRLAYRALRRFELFHLQLALARVTGAARGIGQSGRRR